MTATGFSPIHVLYPDSTARELRITADGCQLHIRPGVAEEWVSGTYQDPSGQRPPRLTQDGGALTIDHIRATRGLMGELVAGDPRFDLLLGTWQPFALTIESAAIQCHAELGGLAITRLGISQRAGHCRLGFSEQNPQSAEVPQLEAQGAVVVGRLTLRLAKEGVLNHG